MPNRHGTPPAPNVLTTAEVARRKCVSRQAVATAAERGTLTTFKQGRTVLVLQDAKLDAYLASTPRPGVAAAEAE